MPTYVRVEDEYGLRFSVIEGEVAANPDAYTVLDEPATDRAGDPLPAERPTVAPPTGGSLSKPSTATPRAGRPSKRRSTKR